MKIAFKIEYLFQFIAFILNPFLGLLSSLYYMFKKDRFVNAFTASLSISLIFIYLPIMYDCSSRFYLYFYQQKSSFLEINLYNKIIIFLHQLFHIEYMSVIYLYTTFIFYIWFFIFKYYKKYADSNKIILLMMIYFISSILYRNIMDLERFYLAVSILLLTIFIVEYKIIKMKALTILTIFFTSTLIHTGAFLLLPIFFISKINLNIKLLAILPILALVFSTNSYYYLSLLLDTPVFTLIDGQTMHLMKAYIDPNSIWGSKNMRYSLVFLRYIELPLMFLIYYKGLILLKNKDSLAIRMVLLLMILAIVFLPYVTLYERFSTTFFIFSIFIIYPVILKKKQDLLLYIILILFIIRFLFINYHIYGMIFTEKYNNVLPNENKKIEMILKPFYYPSVLLLWIDTNGYSDSYIRRESRRGKVY